MSISFIHTGDVHIGMKFTKEKINGDQGNEKRRDIMDTFLKIIDRCDNKYIDFLFIAGDLFEDEVCSIGDLKIINDRFKRLKKTKVIMITGNHDFLNEKSLYKLIDWNENVYLFDNKKIDKITFQEYNIDIWGTSWYEKEKNKESFQNVKLDKNRYNVLLLHGDVIDKNSKYFPINKKAIENLGFDYIGLGHIHKPQYISKDIVYPGSPEPLDFGELGDHGIIEGKIHDNNSDTRFIPISKRKYHIVDIEINQKMSYNDVITQILDITAENIKQKDFFRVVIKGFIDRDLKDKIKEMEVILNEKFYFIEIIDKTKPDYDLDKLLIENENNIIGEFIREMIDKGLDEETINRSLYLGLEELLREKVSLN